MYLCVNGHEDILALMLTGERAASGRTAGTVEKNWGLC
jgi:hypothetical protein